MATATAKSTLGNVFGMIGVTAGAVTTTVGTAVKGVEMLDAFVTKQAAKQAEHDLLEMGAYKLNLLEEMSLERAQRQNEVLKFCNESAVNADLYQQNHAFFSKLLADADKTRARPTLRAAE